MIRGFLLYILPYKLVVRLTKGFYGGNVLTTKDRQYRYWPVDEDHLLLQREWEINLTDKQKRKALRKQNRRIVRAERKKKRAESELHRQELEFERIAAKGGSQ